MTFGTCKVINYIKQQVARFQFNINEIVTRWKRQCAMSDAGWADTKEVMLYSTKYFNTIVYNIYHLDCLQLL